jgi:hypothetical protein
MFSSARFVWLRATSDIAPAIASMGWSSAARMAPTAKRASGAPAAPDDCLATISIACEVGGVSGCARCGHGVGVTRKREGCFYRAATRTSASLVRTEPTRFWACARFVTLWTVVPAGRTSIVNSIPN